MARTWRSGWYTRAWRRMAATRVTLMDVSPVGSARRSLSDVRLKEDHVTKTERADGEQPVTACSICESATHPPHYVFPRQDHPPPAG
ncbi:hypothetical protein MRX96_004749 [Rhipicephalus microplus]